MQHISKERTTHETEYNDEYYRGKHGGTQFKISTELNFNKPKQPKKTAGPYRKYPARPYYAQPSLTSYVPAPIQRTQTYQYPVNEFHHPYHSFTNSYYANTCEPSYLRYPYSYYSPPYLEPGYQINDGYFSDDEYSDEDESFLKKIAGLFKDKKKKKTKRGYSYY